MLTMNSLLSAMKQRAAFNETGKHVFGRGVERTDGRFSEERRDEEKRLKNKSGMEPKI